MSARLCAVALTCLAVVTASLVPHAANGKPTSQKTWQTVKRPKGAKAPRPMKVNARMRRAQRRAQKRSAARAAYRRSPAATDARKASRRRYKGLPRQAAIGLAKQEFAGVFERPLWTPPQVPAGQAIDELLDDHSFFVKTGRGYERTLMQSTGPVSAVHPDTGKRELLSTELSASGDALEPKHSAVPVEV